MRYEELDKRLKIVYSRIRYLDDYHWEIQDDEIKGVHKKSGMKVVVTTAGDEKEAEEKARKMTDSDAIKIIAVGDRGVFSIKHGSFIMTYRYVNSTLSDINDHIVWRGFKVNEEDGKLVQEDLYEYLGDRLIEHIKKGEIAGQDYVFWQFYRCEHCGRYVDLDDVETHLRGHGIKSYDNSVEEYEVFEINFKDRKIYNRFGSEVREGELSEEALEFIRESFEQQ
ncbi:MAG: TBP-interacting protein [Thermococci archaeon]|nr:TBP-interacting protein [Thermococci archaeon]